MAIREQLITRTMSMSEEIDTDDERERHTTSRSEGAISLPDRKLVDRGQITVPSRVRERYDIGVGTVVDLYARLESGETFVVDKIEINTSNMVKVPHRIREYYGLEDGDWLEVSIVPADRDAGE